MKTANKKLLPTMVLFLMLASNLPALADMSGPPTPEQIQEMAKQAEEAAKAQAGAGNGLPSGINPGDTANQQMPNIEEMMKNGQPPAGQMPDFSKLGIDLSKFKMPSLTEGGIVPSFMGKELAGNGADQAAAQIGNALEQIGNQLLEAEDGFKELKDGQIDVNKIAPEFKKARESYNKARDAYANGDYTKAGQYMSQMQKVNVKSKITQAQAGGVSQDLINDIRVKLNAALAQVSKVPDQSEVEADKAMIMSSLDDLKLAESLLKNGDKKGAAKILTEMRKKAPDADINAEAGSFASIPASKLTKIMDKISDGLARAERGLTKSKQSGIEVTAEDEAMIAKAKQIFVEAQTFFDKGDTKATAAKLKEFQDLDLEKYFSNFKDKALPKERQAKLLSTAKNGIKALELTIKNAKEYGMDTAELESLLTQLNELTGKAEQSYNANDREAFLQYMDSIDGLQIGKKVDAIIKNIANERAGELVKEGIELGKKAVIDLTTALEKMDAKKINVNKAKEALTRASAMIDKAQALYDQKKNMDAGRAMDEATASFITVANIIKDSGATLDADAKASIGQLILLGHSSDNMSNVSDDKEKKASDMLGAIDQNDVMEMKNAMMKFNPTLLDKIISFREKDKKFIDSTLKEVMPLIPESEQVALMEGKTGLLAEAQSADKTLSIVKKLKGISTDTIKAVEDIKGKIKSYNFMPKTADKLLDKVEAFNDKIQDGDMTNTKDIKNYVKLLQDEVNKSINESNAEKLKKKIIPAKNIDDNNPLFDEIKYLKDDGAITTDKKDEINVNQVVNGKTITNMINKTIDGAIIKPINTASMTVMDAAKKILDAYGIKPKVNMSDPNQAAKFLNGIGAEIKPGDMKQKADVGDMAELLSAADQRWGSGVTK